jgi:hypothetical protein
VIGATTLNPLGAGVGPVSPPYSSPSSLAEDYGLGDAVDCATQAIVPTPGNPAPPPICICPTLADTPGARGTLDTAGVTGTAVVSLTAATEPVGTYQPVGEVVDDGNNGAGGLIGTAGIIIRYSPDNGRTWLPSQALGTAFTLKMQIGGEDTGVQYDFAPATTNAAYVALAVELRADTLAHLANAVAHDGADTNAGQVALAASSVPATVTASTAVVNLVLTALQLHVVNITSVHDGPDLVAYTALAALTAATTTKEGIDLAIAIKGILNTHEAATRAASAAGLKGATTSIASPTTYTAAAHLLAGGVIALDAQPCRITITVDGGGTPADMPDSVTITGFDYAGNAQTETALDLTGLGTIISAKAFKGTGLSLAFVAADGTGASFTIGYSNAVHNSADVTNTIAAADPTYGTLFTGDTWSESKTTPPMWAVSSLYAAGPPASGAFVKIAQFASTFATIVITEPVQTSDFATIVAGLNYLASMGKETSLVIRFRDRAAGETDAQYITAFRVFAAANHDDRIAIVAGEGWLTEPFRGFRYLRSGLPALIAREQSFVAIPGSLGERIAQSPQYVARGPLEGFSLVDDNGNPIDEAHDEATLGGIDGPINSTGGGITFYFQRRPELLGTYVSEMPVLHPSTSKIYTRMDRRVANGIRRTAASIAWLEIGGASIYDPATLELDADIRDAMASKIAKAIKDRYAREFQNPEDPNLVSIAPTVSVNGSKVTISGTVAWRPYGYVDTIALTFDATR